MISVEHLARLAIDACEAQGAAYMLTGAMAYIENWCAIHGTKERLDKALEEIPPM